ncbi:Eco57I restriction-modification methylase domain-containing protein [Xylanimonas protaetiae]|uniref:site-specific DNA-methyltransferase (adenine-specific) n=1 Tax=Xylanimonas protaetiae TaxID=2509457 RepID=A0A4P6FGL8_9MICO|nr:Eco57I restriction-modification methylase domain-containing protein [Xylanimonas protaetiae]QAY69748.1 SAM-dependent methyltransferase [Xylanimonas protaetiae]
MAVAEAGFVEFGEVFTRRWVVESILDLVGYTTDRDLTATTLVEPSVGSGAFIGPVVERLAATARERGVPFVNLENAIRGYDLQPQHVASCRALAAATLRAHGATDDVARQLAAAWIHTADFLIDDVDMPADFVVGNPPYIRADDLDDATEAAYRARWTTMWGRADIFVGFYERALAMLKPDGKLGFICADRWMRNAYGARLRALISDRYAVETLWQMHDVDAFEADVSAYPAITILARHEQGPVSMLDTTAEFGPTSAVEARHFSLSGAVEGHGAGWAGSRLNDWFEGHELWPAGSPAMIQVLERLNDRFPALEDTGGATKISIGVASGADKAYIVDTDADVEPDRLLPLVMADDIRTGVLGNAQRMLINPWNERGELVDLAAYPRLARTLAGHPAVKKRFVARKNPERWHRTIDKVYPGLAERPKLLLQDMKARITPVLEPGGLYPHHNLYYIVSTGWDLEVLGGILMSEVAEAFVDAYGVKMRGGTLRFQAQYLRKIRVPEPASIAPEVESQLRKAFRNRDRAAATRAAEAAYGLTEGTMSRVRNPLGDPAA